MAGKENSNAGNGPSGSGNGAGWFAANGMIKIKEDSEEFVIVQHRLYMNLGSLVPHCRLVELHRVRRSITRSCWGAFDEQLKAMEQKHGGDANVQIALRETTKEKAIRTINEGFDLSEMPEDGGYFGMGLYFYPEPVAINSVMSATADVNGMRHVLLCRVILGKVEEVVRGSGQCQPSSGCFDSAVDNQKSPARYILWYHDANSRVMPMHVLSIKVDFRNRGLLPKVPAGKPASAWMSIKDLLRILAKSLPPSTMCQLRRLHMELMEKKTTRKQLVSGIRQITGDKILIDAIESIQAQQAAASNASRKGGKT